MKPRKKNKYRNKIVNSEGITFSSKKEYRRYCELKLLEKGGIITDLQRQVKFILIPAQREPDSVGKRGGVIKGKVIEKECSYYADFVYFENGNKVVEDTKGIRTADYIIKRKLMLFIHSIRIKEI